MTRRPRLIDTRPPRILAAAIALAAVLASVGCARTPLRPDDERTPFDRYHRARSTQPEPYVQDEFGRRRPNLRERLLRDDG